MSESTVGSFENLLKPLKNSESEGEREIRV